MILLGGGSGYELVYFGYVGEGMLLVVISGFIFVLLCVSDILEIIRFINWGKGVFVIIKNFEVDLEEFF